MSRYQETPLRNVVNTLALLLFVSFLVACDSESGGAPFDDEPDWVECQGDVCFLTGTLTNDLTLTADREWVLRGGVFIGDDIDETVLTIEPGTTIYGETSTQGMLVVRRGSRVEALGTREAPIVFTSSKEPGSRARGDWGGIILNGRARINACADAESTGPCEAFGEGGTGFYGGEDDEDSSGTLRYVRIEFAGRLISPDNELNGLALQGAGRGTTLEYIQIHMSKDDAIEFFGGTANFKYVLTTGTADDNLDWTDGWRGRGQFFVGQQYEDAGDNGIEAHNNAEDNRATPRSHPMVSNVTLIGSPHSEHSDLGILLREGTAGHVSNAIVVGFNEACFDIDHAETFANALNPDGTLSGELNVAHSIFHCELNFKERDDDPVALSTLILDLCEGNQIADPLLIDPFNEAAPDFRPGPGSPALSGAVIPDDPFFDRVTFKGGVDPDDDWTKDWTTSARN